MNFITELGAGEVTRTVYVASRRFSACEKGGFLRVISDGDMRCIFPKGSVRGSILQRPQGPRGPSWGTRWPRPRPPAPARRGAGCCGPRAGPLAPSRRFQAAQRPGASGCPPTPGKPHDGAGTASEGGRPSPTKRPQQLSLTSMELSPARLEPCPRLTGLVDPGRQDMSHCLGCKPRIEAPYGARRAAPAQAPGAGRRTPPRRDSPFGSSRTCRNSWAPRDMPSQDVRGGAGVWGNKGHSSVGCSWGACTAAQTAGWSLQSPGPRRAGPLPSVPRGCPSRTCPGLTCAVTFGPGDSAPHKPQVGRAGGVPRRRPLVS